MSYTSAVHGLAKAYKKQRPKMKLHLKKGALHAQLHVPQGQKIPASKLQAAKSHGGLEAKRAQFAINARKWNHK